MKFRFIIFIALFTCCFFSCSPYSRPENTVIAKERAFDYYLEGLDAYQKQDYSRALKQAEKAIEINDHFAQFYELKGNILKAMGDLSGALDALHKALDFRSNYTIVLKTIGDIYGILGDYSIAIQYYNRALSSDNSNYDIFLDIADANLQLGDYTRALYALKEYQRMLEQFNGVLDKRYYNLSGETYFYTGRFTESIAQLRQADISDKVLYLLGRNYYACRDYDTGLTYFNMLMQKDNTAGKWYFYRAIYFFQKNNYEDALNQFNQALKLDASLYDAYYFIGKIHESRKEYRAAWESFRLFRESMTDKDELRYLQEKVVLPDEAYLIE